MYGANMKPNPKLNTIKLKVSEEDLIGWIPIPSDHLGYWIATDVIREYLQATFGDLRLLRQTSYLYLNSIVVKAVERSVQNLVVELEFTDEARVSNNAMEAWSEYIDYYGGQLDELKHSMVDPLVHLLLSLFHYRQQLFDLLPVRDISEPSIYAMRKSDGIEYHINYKSALPEREGRDVPKLSYDEISARVSERIHRRYSGDR